MTLKELMARFRDDGYEGPADRAKVQAWFDSDACGIRYEDAGGKSLGFDDIWPKAIVHKGITLSVSKNASEPDTVEVVDDSPAEDMPPEGESAAPPMKARTVDAKATQATRIAGKLTNKAFSIGRPEVKAYQNKISRRSAGGFNHIKERAVFDDVEKAELAGAWCRLRITSAGGIGDYAQKARDEEIVQKGALEGINAQGGATLGETFIPELIELLDSYGAARQLCNFRSLSGPPPYTFPRMTADPTVTWTGEAAASSDQDPSFDNVTISPKKLQGIMYESSEILEDSALNISDLLFNGFARGIALKEDSAFFLGDGTSTYGGVTGFLNAIGSAGQTAQATGATWNAMVDADIQAMLGTLPSYAWTGTPKMTCTPAAFYNIINRLSRGMGGVTYTESQSGVVRPVYNGYPVVFNNVMASATAVSTISVLFGDFDMAAKCGVIPGSLEFATSEHYRFANDQITLRARERVGITVHDAGDSTNAGPVVALATDAS